jgi:60 kDa SS-A/Ro ribonucleoprotein
MDRELFSTTSAPPTAAKNRAGGAAYSFSDKEALAQYAATGFFGSTYYVGAKEQVDEVAKLCANADPEFVAKCAVYSRREGDMKDMPAYLLAHLSARGPEGVRWLGRAWPHVIDNGKMLRNFVQVVRSSAVGRKNFGSAPRRMIAHWLRARRPESLLRDTVGEKPSIADVIKMAHPRPASPEQEAFWRYLLGKELKEGQRELLPPAVLQYERFKAERGEVPDVDFRMLDSLQLTDDEWKQVARRAPWLMTLKNINTFNRHGVLADAELVKVIAARLRNPELVRKSRVFPYQILGAYRAVSQPPPPAFSWSFTPPAAQSGIPAAIVEALHAAMEIAVENCPKITGNVVICPDTSGSMNSPVTGARGAATTAMRYVDVAALFAAVMFRSSERVLLLPFDTKVYATTQLPRTPEIIPLADGLSKLGGGGTNCELPLLELNRRGMSPDAVIYISDNESWYTHAAYNRGTPMMDEWLALKRRAARTKLVCIDIAAATSAQAPSSPDRLNVGGFSDAVFSVVADFLSGASTNWVARIEATEL